MKNKQLLCVLFPLLVACTGQRHQQQVSSESIIEEAVRKGEVLKGEIVPIDTALFRYAYRMRVQGDKAVILDLHNADYYYHVFTYPDFQYQSSFGKRGEGPGESIYAANIRFAGQDTVWVLDDGKGRMYQYSGIAGGKTPKQEKDILLDKRLFRSLDFDLKDASTVVIPDYSGENRFSWASLSSGELLRKSEQIPVSDPELLRESAPAVAQGWNSFVSFSPDKKILVSVTQFGDRLDIYSMASQKHIGELGGDGEPQFKVSPEGYGLPAGRICYYDVQVTDQYIYTIYDGRKFKDIMKLADAYQQGGKILRISTHEGDVVKTYVLDRPIAGIYVDEAAGMLFGLDVNADEQIVKFPLELEYNAWLEYEWDTVLEFCQMILETKNYANADITPYLPLIESSLTFFDEHYRQLASRRGRKALDGNGHLILFPGSACETYKMTNNASSTIAALKVVLETYGEKEEMLKAIPPIPLRYIEIKDTLNPTIAPVLKQTISPAVSWERINNVETPQLYPVFPWRIYGVGKEDLDIARNTYFYDPDAIKFRSHTGWKQDNIWAACLGLTEEAKKLSLAKLSNGPHRFPAFWGPGYDWTPDHNWGGSGMIGLQEMLLQTNGEQILLFPAWPKEWNVHFKLHAPGETTVEATLKNGKVTDLKVLPESRKKDIVIMIEKEK